MVARGDQVAQDQHQLKTDEPGVHLEHQEGRLGHPYHPYHPPIRMDSQVCCHSSALQSDHLRGLMQQIGTIQRASPNDHGKQATAQCAA